ncbi:MAG: TlpA family protein disulfide reductase, partial [Bacteroidaceae bacterium]|nr:TlpA family protein disulfide reductase [Bacteroidaceae bacterium]
GGNGGEERTIQRADYEGKPLLIAFWATWKSGSQNAVYRARRLHREMKGRGKDINLISYSLDIDEKRLRRIEERDSIDYPSYCDFRCLSSPLVQQWGIRELPYFVLVAPDGRIAAMGSNWVRDIQSAADQF